MITASGVVTCRRVSPGCPFCPPRGLPDGSRRLLVRAGFFNPSLDGGLLLLLLLIVYATLALMVAMKTQNPVNRLVAVGAMTFMVGQSLLNIAVATGSLPTTGLPLPLISYGSNSMIASLLIAGLLIRVARESSEAEVVSIQERRTAARL